MTVANTLLIDVRRAALAMLLLASQVHAAAPITVGTAPVRHAAVPVTLTAVGNAEAYATVSVKSRVEGQIDRVFFKDGQRVKAGEPLFEIDPRSFRVDVALAEANLEKAKAELANAAAQQQRYQSLSTRQFVSRADAQQIKTNLDTARAAVAADRAELQSARLRLGYTTIRAPIAGRAGAVQLQSGNLVKANDTTALVVIRQITPIYVSFSVPEQYLGEIRHHSAGDPLVVRVAGRDGVWHTGKLSFVDNSVDATTGTVRLKATFDNRDEALWPGQFVRAVLTLATQHDALVIPSRAVETGQNGSYVYVVGSDNTVERRQITTGRVAGDDIVVSRGLAVGEQVVISGQIRLAPGVKVAIRAGDAQ